MRSQTNKRVYVIVAVGYWSYAFHDVNVNEENDFPSHFVFAGCWARPSIKCTVFVVIILNV